MNWKRIASGALWACAVLTAVDAGVLAIQYFVFKNVGNLTFWSVALGLLSYLLDGFFCAWLYAVMRPRLGPGPRTAGITGTAIFFIKEGLALFFAGRGAPWLLLLWIKLALASYAAGWQYIEKAP